ncbi:DNA alkylation repair protein [Paenibacillus sp. B1-33]|uniref:DNA alkylation repair protein n=1 Tax=unclassified Paenibacillus TaxID=185978 RepID=UPI003D265D8A
MNIYPLEPLIDAFRLYAAQYLWELEEWFAYLAMGLLDGGVKFLNLSHIHRIEQFIIIRSWWDTVDGLATCTVGGLMKRYPEAWEEYANRWIHADQMWLNRTGIL